LIASVRHVLDMRSPQMVDPAETFITGEGVDVCLLVIPHRWLGGVSLIVRSDPPEIDLLWAGVTDLSYHDQLDLGYVVGRWPAAPETPLAVLEAKLAEELSRRIEWKQTYRGPSPTPRRITAVLDLDGRRVTVNVLRGLSLWPFPRRDVVEQTSLDSSEPPAFRLPVPIDKLLPRA
jgi:hypothetical protein